MKISRSTVNLDNLHRRSILCLSSLADRMSSVNQGAAGRIVSHLVFNGACFHEGHSERHCIVLHSPRIIVPDLCIIEFSISVEKEVKLIAFILR